jgi:hypothetical protein
VTILGVLIILIVIAGFYFLVIRARPVTAAANAGAGVATTKGDEPDPWTGVPMIEPRNRASSRAAPRRRPNAPSWGAPCSPASAWSRR